MQLTNVEVFMNKQVANKLADEINELSESENLTHSEIAEQTMLGDLMNLVVENAKALPKSWQELSENEQCDYLNRIELQCRSAISECVKIIASQGFIRIPVQIKQTTIKESAVVQCELIHTPQVIDLVSADTKIAMLVLADSTAFTQDENKPAPDKQQKELGMEYHEQ